MFDLDGVLMDSEPMWDRARQRVVEEQGGRWAEDATSTMQGMSSREWSRYMHEVLGVRGDETRTVELVVGHLLEQYEASLPLLPGAREAVLRMGANWPLGLASSSNRVVIDRVLDLARLTSAFAVVVSSEEVPRGKPAPDVYLDATRRLGCLPTGCVAVEDSANGIRAAASAGLAVVAVPDRRWPPPPDVLSRAALVLTGLDQLTLTAVQGMDSALLMNTHQPGDASDFTEKRLDEVERESFPASDPHSDWAGP